FHPQDHARIRAGGVEPAAILPVPELLVLPLLQLTRPPEPVRIAPRLKQLDKAEDEIRVVFRVSVDRGVPVAVPSLHDLTAGVPHVALKEASTPRSGLEIACA